MAMESQASVPPTCSGHQHWRQKQPACEEAAGARGGGWGGPLRREYSQGTEPEEDLGKEVLERVMISESAAGGFQGLVDSGREEQTRW